MAAIEAPKPIELTKTMLPTNVAINMAVKVTFFILLTGDSGLCLFKRILLKFC